MSTLHTRGYRPKPGERVRGRSNWHTLWYQVRTGQIRRDAAPWTLAWKCLDARAEAFQRGQP